LIEVKLIKMHFNCASFTRNTKAAHNVLKVFF